MLPDSADIKIVTVICLTILGCTYFVTVRRDGTVLLILSSIISGIAGYQLGKKKTEEDK